MPASDREKDAPGQRGGATDLEHEELGEPTAGRLDAPADSIFSTANSICRTADSIYPTADSIYPTADSVYPTANSVYPTADSIHPTANSVYPTQNSVCPTAVTHVPGPNRQALVWMARGLKAGDLKPGSLSKVKGSDPRKVLLAELLWRRMVVSQEWLAAKLEMSSAANVSQQLRRLDGKSALKKVSEDLKHFLEEADATNS